MNEIITKCNGQTERMKAKVLLVQREIALPVCLSVTLLFILSDATGRTKAQGPE